MNQEILIKMASFCAYRERCHSEVRRKLYDLKCFGEEAEEIIVELIAQDLLNEERFARAFARGKFRIKGWGRIKIKAELQRLQIRDRLIAQALASEIPEEEYRATLLKAAEKKKRELARVPAVQREEKLKRYLLSRGFESGEIQRMLKDV